jgi:predicted TIM-barrel fold metal-dependent hydrolase
METAMTIVDAHHHIWRQADLPWLQGPMVPRIFGPYEPIRRDYPIEEFLADLGGSGVEKSVYVQTNWAKAGAVDEVEWVQSVADRHGWPHAIVGYADLLDDGASDMLKRQARYPLMRGIRMQLHWHENETYRFAAAPDLMNDRRFRENIRLVAGHGWSFDLQVFASQMADAARLAADNPDITFVLQHAGMLEDLAPAGRAAWKDGMKRLAGQQNIVSKLSGLGTFIHRNDASHVEDVALQTVEMFGAERCLFGSNFPIEKLWTGYAELVAAHRKAIVSLSAAEQEAILRGTATRVYRL